ncbi:MAG: hypothetical protein GYB27_03020 [Rhodobacteraceae bacterium]|nr:hypothetical protein [Paracoccaceae bacterium]
MDKKLLLKPSLFLNFLLLVVTGFFGFKNYEIGRDYNEISSQLLSIQQNSFSFSASIENNSLVLSGSGSTFSEPSSLRIVPHFNQDNGLTVEGYAFSVPTGKGKADISNKKIRYENIVEAVCDYPQNLENCKNGLAYLEIQMVVNGKSDTDTAMYSS